MMTAPFMETSATNGSGRSGIDYEHLEEALSCVLKKWRDAQPVCGMILGSGWSDVAEAFTVRDTMPYSKIQGLGVPGVAGHSGRLVWAEHAGLETFIFQGRRHWYEGVGWTPVALPVFLLKRMNARVTVITNAAGGIRDDLKPGDLMILDDHINFMGSNPLIGPHREIWGPRFPDQTYLYSSRLRAVLDEVARETDIPVTHGVYLAGSGPTYETPAEVRACTALGADAVGMSTVPEAILANAAGMKVAGISCITNYAAGILDQPLSHEEVTQATATAMPRMKTLLLKCWDKLADSALI